MIIARETDLELADNRPDQWLAEQSKGIDRAVVADVPFINLFKRIETTEGETLLYCGTKATFEEWKKSFLQ